MLKPLPSNTKFSRYRKAPKDPLKRAKRKETEGQKALTSELLSIGLKKKRKSKIIERPKTQKRKRKIKNFYKVIYLKEKRKVARGRGHTSEALERESKTQRFTATMATRKAQSKRESEK